MATFNTDSLDFRDEEEARFGTDDDFGVSYNSANDALEIEDRVNTAIASIPRNVGTDLVGGKFAETVSEGKALADDGNVYNTIQRAVDNAQSWVKVGPGTHSSSTINVREPELSIIGSGKGRTTLKDGIIVESENVTISDLKIDDSKYIGVGDEKSLIEVNDNGCSIHSVIADYRNIDTYITFLISAGDFLMTNCRFKGESNRSAFSVRGDESLPRIIVGNIIEEEGENAILGYGGNGNNTVLCNNQLDHIFSDASDCIVSGNIFTDRSDRAMFFRSGSDNIIVKNIVHGRAIETQNNAVVNANN